MKTNDLEERLEKYFDDVKCTDIKNWNYWGSSNLVGTLKVEYFKNEIWPKLLNGEKVFTYNDHVFNRRFISTTGKWKKVCSLVYRNRALYLTSPQEWVRKLAEIIDKRLYLD